MVIYGVLCKEIQPSSVREILGMVRAIATIVADGSVFLSFLRKEMSHATTPLIFVPSRVIPSVNIPIAEIKTVILFLWLSYSHDYVEEIYITYTYYIHITNYVLR